MKCWTSDADTSDTNHSALVEEALSRAGLGGGEPAVEEALSQAGPVGGESVETDTCQIYVKSLDQNENVNSSKQDGMANSKLFVYENTNIRQTVIFLFINLWYFLDVVLAWLKGELSDLFVFCLVNKGR